MTSFASVQTRWGIITSLVFWSILWSQNVILGFRLTSKSQRLVELTESKPEFKGKKNLILLAYQKEGGVKDIKRIRRFVQGISPSYKTSLLTSPSLLPFQVIPAGSKTVALKAPMFVLSANMKSMSASTLSKTKQFLVTPSLSPHHLPWPPPVPPPPPPLTSSPQPSPPLPPSPPSLSFPPPQQLTLPTPPIQTCPPHFTCKGRCLKKVLPQEKYVCQCDPECEIFADCCADFDQYCNATADGQNILKNTHELWRCQKHISPFYWMIEGCPTSWSNIDVLRKCVSNRNIRLTAENYANIIPVFDKNTSISYSNRFCAECNGVQSDHMTFHGLNFSCTLAPPQGLSRQEALKFLFRYCQKITLKPNEGHIPRTCLDVLFEETCYMSTPFDDLCSEKPPRIVFSLANGRNYKNIYCAMCDGWTHDFIVCGPSVPLEPPFISTAVPFSVIMDISANKQVQRKVKATCKKNEVYDVYLELCRSVFNRNRLESMPEVSQFDKYRIALWVTASIPSKLLISLFNSSIIVNIFKKNFGLNGTQIQFVDWQKVPKISDVVTLFFDVQTSSRDSINRARQNLGNSSMVIDSILNFTRPFKLQWKQETFTVIKATTKRLTCISIQYYTPEQYVVLPDSNNVYINDTEEVLSEKEYISNLTKMRNDVGIPIGKIAVCKKQAPAEDQKNKLKCVNGSLIILYDYEYVLLSNTSAYRNISGTIYNPNEYFKTNNGTVIVCSYFSNEYKKLNWEPQRYTYDKTLTILTSIGLSLSVFCLTFTIVTYSLFAELRTLPGINLMNLSSALLVGHFFWLIGSSLVGHHRACVAVAVILHFAFLASFVWMSIIAFSTWKAFSARSGPIGRSSDKEYKIKRIRRTFALGWLPVFIFVLICVSLDQSQVVMIQYGGPKGCWINNGIANLCIFVVPVVIAILWNAVFFGLTVKSIHKARQQARLVSEQRENQKHYSVYIKISVLMGFTWIFGVLGSLISAYFMYPFIVLCTLQGVQIAVSFTFTRRVLNMYKERFCHMQTENSSNRKPRSNTRETKTEIKDTKI